MLSNKKYFCHVSDRTLQMPRYGVLSTQHDHWLQVKWQGSFAPVGSEDENVFHLDKSDVETVGSRDQIKIRQGCALIRAPEICHAISIELYLPPQVKKVIVHKYGQADAYCFFRKRGNIVYPGEDLEKDPFHH